MKRKICLMALAALTSAGAFAMPGNPDNAMNKLKSWKEQRVDEDMQDDIVYKQQAIYDILQDEAGIRADLQSLEARKERALQQDRPAKAARLDRKIAFDNALLQADEESIHGELTVERSDMRVLNELGIKN